MGACFGVGGLFRCCEDDGMVDGQVEVDVHISGNPHCLMNFNDRGMKLQTCPLVMNALNTREKLGMPCASINDQIKTIKRRLWP